jgi:rubrerythrin
MDEKITLGQVLEMAIAAEQAAETLYRELEVKFAAVEDVALCWRHCAFDEVEHATWLKTLRSQLGAEEQAGQVEADIAASVRAMAHFSVEKALDGVQTLEDAFQLVTEVENGETNALFRFLIDNFEPDEQLRESLESQLIQHVGRISVNFPAQYKRPASRRAIRVAEDQGH